MWCSACRTPRIASLLPNGALICGTCHSGRVHHEPVNETQRQARLVLLRSLLDETNAEIAYLERNRVLA